ncbi:VOC family protein [Halomarina litorea]|uniref:VOC family protein n=1 Tax=Halomarina litorea TaxID=2961595 RepID=UPI0020C282AC|nr:VOC family protein [Halomarina sp. BCD28]
MEDRTDTLPATTRIGRVALRVNDLDEMTDFYEGRVGLSVQRRTAERAVLGADDTPLLELFADPGAALRGASETGLFHTAFLFPTRGSLGAALERVEADWRLDGASDHGVSEAVYCTDPEGNGVELYHDRPKEVWPIGPDGRVRMGSDRLALDDLRAASTGDRVAPEGTTVGHVHLEVSSLAAARAFYVDALGLRVRQTDDRSVLFLAAGGYHHHLGLNTWNGRTDPLSGRGLAWLELVVPDRTTLDAVGTRLGAETSVRDTDDGIEATGPDGVPLRVRIG